MSIGIISAILKNKILEVVITLDHNVMSDKSLHRTYNYDPTTPLNVVKREVFLLAQNELNLKSNIGANVELDDPVSIFPPVALLKQGFPWDYSLTEVPNVYQSAGNYKLVQINMADSTGPWRTELLFPAQPYNKKIRFDWLMNITDDWEIDNSNIPSHLIWQGASVDNQALGYLSPNFMLAVKNNNFVFYYKWADGNPAGGGGTVELCSFPLKKSVYKLSIRLRPHLAKGDIEVWVDNVLIGSAYNVPCAYSDTPLFFKYGLYRWIPFANSMRVFHGPMMTGNFDFVKP